MSELSLSETSGSETSMTETTKSSTFMSNRASDGSLSLSNYISHYYEASSTEDDDLMANVLKFIRGNINAVLHDTASVNELDHSDFNFIFVSTSDSLDYVQSEQLWLNTILSWVIYDYDERYEHIHGLLETVKVSFLSDAELVATLNIHPLLRDEVHDFVRHKSIDEADVLPRSYATDSHLYLLFVCGASGISAEKGNILAFGLEKRKWYELISFECNIFKPSVMYDKGRVYLSGGLYGEAYRYDISEGQVHSLGQMNTHRSCHALVSLNEKVYAIGGEEGSDSMEVWEPEVGSWREIRAKLPGPITRPRAFVMNSLICIIQRSHGDIVQFHPETENFEIITLRSIPASVRNYFYIKVMLHSYGQIGASFVASQLVVTPFSPGFLDSHLYQKLPRDLKRKHLLGFCHARPGLAFFLKNDTFYHLKVLEDDSREIICHVIPNPERTRACSIVGAWLPEHVVSTLQVCGDVPYICCNRCACTVRCSIV